ncbi:DNA circularization N-terminal domain-containing protein [Chitinibacter fontanus]|uniref:DNA circularization N-terminal domain-containing protein n=1 Tax=Chitinibacter fontanus TaxID=1737446 RepID=A0A7D5ZFG2_9NEIS|nr:DNA circularization N-terminal domain-containing protein [Chitinibacter fontanus]QLI80787.1 DNA circularization N-terminal domain-containing protein [Chitinibacter fontanus]
MSSWRDNLRPASFRGVGFLFDDGDMSGGRRLQVNEYPQRDKPFVEDLGRKARSITINGYVLGDDYAQKRDQLLAALEQSGEGELIHPRLGSLKVFAGEFRYSETKEEGRMARFSLSFTEAGELAFPTSQANFGAAGAGLAADLQAGEALDFASDIDVGTPDLEKAAMDRLNENIHLGVGLIKAGVDIVHDWPALLKNPLVLVDRYFAMFEPDSLGLWGAGKDVYGQLGGLLRQSEKTRSPVAKLPPAAPPNLVALERNNQAIDRLHRSAVLASVSRVASDLPRVQAPVIAVSVAAGSVGASVAAKPVVVVHQDAEQLRKDVIAQLDAEESHGATYEARRLVLSSVRANTVQGIKAAQRDAVRLVEVLPPEVEPAVLTAYRLYGNALRGDEIVQRNGLVHPGFVPVEPLKVLEK